jgi:hypothetical protein
MKISPYLKLIRVSKIDEALIDEARRQPFTEPMTRPFT